LELTATDEILAVENVDMLKVLKSSVKAVKAKSRAGCIL
jgi:hypothetical protein